MAHLKRFLIERDIAGIGGMSIVELCGAARASNRAIEQVGNIHWQHSYVSGDKTFCVYLAESEDAIRRHSDLSGIPFGKITEVAQDTHARVSPVEVLAKLKPVYEGGVQTGGNSSALVDAAAACVVTSGTYAKAHGKKPIARVVAAAVAGVPPEIMGIGPAPAIRLLLARTGLKLSDISRFEINEAQGAQTLAVGRELGLDLSLLNVNGGAIALGHPLAATGVRLTITLARELARSGKRYGISSACVGGGQGIALLIENPNA